MPKETEGPKCEACGERTGFDATGEGRRFCLACVEKPTITPRLAECGHLLNNLDDTCGSCKRHIRNGNGMTYNPGLSGGPALDADGEVVVVETVKAETPPRRN